MRTLTPILVLTLLALLPGFASAEPLSVSVGKRSTWLNLDTGDLRVHGRRVRQVEIDTALVRTKCVEAVDDFEGDVRLSHETRGSEWIVRVECMKRRETRIGAEPAGPVEDASDLALEAQPSLSAENS